MAGDEKVRIWLVRDHDVVQFGKRRKIWVEEPFITCLKKDAEAQVEMQVTGEHGMGLDRKYVYVRPLDWKPE